MQSTYRHLIAGFTLLGPLVQACEARDSHGRNYWTTGDTGEESTLGDDSGASTCESSESSSSSIGESSSTASSSSTGESSSTASSSSTGESSSTASSSSTGESSSTETSEAGRTSSSDDETTTGGEACGPGQLCTTPEDAAVGQTRFDCGCSQSAGVCACEGGLEPSDLGEGCLFDPTTCDIVCSNGLEFACDDTIYVSDSPSDQPTTELFTLDPATLTTAPVASTNLYGYDAIGFNHLDGLIYGISNRTADDPGPAHLVSIDRQGNVTDLGTLGGALGSGTPTEWIVGTILEDGTYVIGQLFTNDWLAIDLTVNPPVVVDGGVVVPNIPSAWTAHPTDGLIYGYQFLESSQLSTFDVATGTLTLLGELINTETSLPVGQLPCSATFTQSGDFYLFCTVLDEIFLVDIDALTATPVASGPGLGAGDMASCVFPQ